MMQYFDVIFPFKKSDRKIYEFGKIFLSFFQKNRKERWTVRPDAWYSFYSKEKDYEERQKENIEHCLFLSGSEDRTYIELFLENKKFNKYGGIETTISIDKLNPRLNIALFETQGAYFSDDEEDKAKTEKVDSTVDLHVQIARHIFSKFKLNFAFGPGGYYLGEAPYPLPEDPFWNEIAAGKLRYLFPVNFWSAGIVKSLGGLQKVLKAPAWKVEELPNGGVMLVVDPNPVYPRYPSTELNPFLKVGTYLGLKWR